MLADRLLFASLTVAMLCAPARGAYAFEKQHHIGGGISGGLVAVRDASPLLDAGLTGHYGYGLNDQFNFVAEGSFALAPARHASAPSSSARSPSLLGHVGAGVVYNLDVVRLVPYGGVLVTGYALGGGGFSSPIFAGGAALALGLDWHKSRKFGLGFTFRQHMMLTQITDYPSFTELGVRAEYTWGF